MTPSEQARSWFENVWNKQDEQYIRTHLKLDKDTRQEVGGIGTPREGTGSANTIQSVDEFVTFWQTILGAIDGFNVRVKRLFETGNEACGIAELSGRDIKSGTPVQFDLGFWIKVDGNVIVEAENVVDFHRYLVQVDSRYQDSLQQHLGSHD